MEVILSQMDKKKKYAYDIKYNQDRTTTVNVRLNYNTDADIIEFLQTVQNKQGLIKDLLRKYMTDNSFYY